MTLRITMRHHPMITDRRRRPVMVTTIMATAMTRKAIKARLIREPIVMNAGP